MILVSVGTQLPFDRLVRTVDRWAESTKQNDIVAQIGATDYKPRAMTAIPFLPAAEFAQLQSRAAIIVAHAGIGSILGALESGTPIVVMPRNHLLGEHRNAHQCATVDRFRGYPGVHVADNEEILLEILSNFSDITAGEVSSLRVPNEFTSRLRVFIHSREQNASWWRLAMDRMLFRR